jgi:Phosphoadenosine phosphosulfate reductase family
MPTVTVPPELRWLAWFLAQFDGFIAHTSGGKDSELTIKAAVELLEPFGLLDSFAALHLVLDREDTQDPRVEWQQVPELAAEQAARMGVPLAAGGGWQVWRSALAKEPLTSRQQWAGQMHFARRDFPGDLLDDIGGRTRRDGSVRGWPTMWTRYCTSDWKTSVGRAFTEHLCKQIRAERGLTRPVRILQFMGFRAEESTDRANRHPISYRPGVSAKGSRWIWEYLPIHDLTLNQVWSQIRASGLPYHPAYDEGMSRLSCRRCIFASRRDLSIAHRMDPAGHAAYVAMEQGMNDPFQVSSKTVAGQRTIAPKPLAVVTPAAGPDGFAVHWLPCPTCGVRVLANTREQQRWCPAHTDGPVPQVPPQEHMAPPCTQLAPPTSAGALFDLVEMTQ